MDQLLTTRQADPAAAPQVESVPVIVTSADDNFAMQLAALASSLGRNASGDVRLFVFDGGISPENKVRVRDALPPQIREFTWLTPKRDAVSSLKTPGHFVTSTYYRLQITDLLPASLSKAIYLDPDIIVLADIYDLWRLPLRSHHLLAVHDVYAPFMDAAQHEAFEKIRPYIRCSIGLKGFRRLGIPPQTPCFNAGVMVLNLDLWRRDAVGPAVLRYLQDHNAEIAFADQDGLNAVLWNKWAELPPAWNQMPGIYAFPTWRHSLFTKSQFADALKRPRIVHFAGPIKPWTRGIMHPFRPNFFEHVDHTEWAGWGHEIRQEWPMRWPRLWHVLRTVKRAAWRWRVAMWPD